MLLKKLYTYWPLYQLLFIIIHSHVFGHLFTNLTLLFYIGGSVFFFFPSVPLAFHIIHVHENLVPTWTLVHPLVQDPLLPWQGAGSELDVITRHSQNR